jgi:hypothetical protein
MHCTTFGAATRSRNAMMPDARRRHFVQHAAAMPVAALLGAAAVVPEGAQAHAHPAGDWLWRSADVLIGQSIAEQAPSQAITCPMYFPNGHPADASHTLDLAAFPVRGDLTWGRDTISPDLGASLAVSPAMGTDGVSYLLVAAEGPVTGARGYFAGVQRVIVRCKYKVVQGPQGPLLVACKYCVAILVRD